MFKTILLAATILIASAASTLAVDLQGAGASFPYPFYSKVFDSYKKTTSVKVNYQAIGSGGGIKQTLNQVVDFGASDKPMSDKKLKAAPGEIFHLPTCLGAVVVSYNLKGTDGLKLNADVLSAIFLGKIKKWNDKKIQKLNKGVKLPNKSIKVVHRADGSGTTFIFTDYLSSVNKKWKNRVGKGKTVDWPVGIGAPQNAGVAAQIKNTEGAIGYIELAYAKNNNLPFATLQNNSKNWITPSLEATSQAANVKLPADTRVSLVDSDAKQGYPIASFTWLLIYKEQNYKGRTQEQAIETYKTVKYLLTTGQNFASELDYAPLPASAKKQALSILDKIEYNGKLVKDLVK